MKFVIGKKYKLRNGFYVVCVAIDTTAANPIRFRYIAPIKRKPFWPEGQFIKGGIIQNEDVIEEVKEPVSEVPITSLKVGDKSSRYGSIFKYSRLLPHSCISCYTTRSVATRNQIVTYY